MDLNNDFRVGVDVAEAWRVLTDVERIAPLLPGAQLQEIDGDEYRGIVKVKVGPITAQYKGKASFVEKDQHAGRLVLRAKGRDTRGQGNASAHITVKLDSESASSTKVDVHTDLTVTGKVAQFGRGVMADVSAKLIRQFVDNLEADIAKHGTGSHGQAGSRAGAGSHGEGAGAGAGSRGEGAGAGSHASAGSEQVAASSAAGSSAPTAGGRASGPVGSPIHNGASQNRLRVVEQPEPDPVDLFDAAGGSVAKRLAPVFGGLGLLAVGHVTT